MLWIVIGGFLGFGIVAWARASKRRFEAEEAARRERQASRALEREEEALLARLRVDQRKQE